MSLGVSLKQTVAVNRPEISAGDSLPPFAATLLCKPVDAIREALVKIR